MAMLEILDDGNRTSPVLNGFIYVINEIQLLSHVHWIVLESIYPMLKQCTK